MYVPLRLAVAPVLSTGPLCITFVLSVQCVCAVKASRCTCVFDWSFMLNICLECV